LWAVARAVRLDQYGAMQFHLGPHSRRTTLRITLPDTAAALAAVQARLEAEQGFALATLNLDHLVKLSRDVAFQDAYAAHDMVTADGNPVVWLSRIARRPVELVPGADLVLPLARIAAKVGAGVALVGSTQNALDRASANLQGQVPGLSIVHRAAPPMGFDPSGPEAQAVLDAVAASGARLCFLALGAPRQERLAALGRTVAPRVGFVSVGAAIDFLAGTQSRAPAWVQRMALEWLWRLLSDPGRLAGRYLRCALILPGHVWRAWRLPRRD